MAITLRIDNFDQLPDGGPIEFTAGPRGFDIGREQHLDWCLPDPDRVISGHHCQVRYEGGAYWLHDVSRNGTFVNGAAGRVQTPYRLGHGDRLQIGHYFIRVALSGAGEGAVNAQQQPPAFQPAPSLDPWALEGEVPQPVDRRWFTSEQRRDRGQRAADPFSDHVALPSLRQPAPASFGNAMGGPGNMPAPYLPDRAAVAYPGSPRPTAPAPGGGADIAASSFIEILAAAAGVSPQALATRPPEQVAAEIGTILRIVTEQLASLLQARAAAKQMTKSGNRTMIGADHNNPLKFIPNATEALQIMFLRNRPGYLSAPESFKEGFDNIKTHEMATYAAMQKALLRLMEDFHPDKIEDKAGNSAFGSKKARAWDIYLERWNAKTEHYENGMLDVFLTYFADAYDAAAKGK